jgi:hypothetical protein
MFRWKPAALAVTAMMSAIGVKAGCLHLRHKR